MKDVHTLRSRFTIAYRVFVVDDDLDLVAHNQYNVGGTERSGNDLELFASLKFATKCEDGCFPSYTESFIGKILHNTLKALIGILLSIVHSEFGQAYALSILGLLYFRKEVSVDAGE